jgi:cytochrome P450
MQYEPFVENCLKLLLQRLHELSASGQPVEMSDWLQYYAFDVIGEITFSTRLGFLEKGEDQNGLIYAIHGSLKYTNTLGLYHWLHPYAWKLVSLVQSNGERFIIDFIGKSIADHKASPKEINNDGPLSFVQRWLNVEEHDSDKMSMREIMIGAGQNIGAGSDTTAASMSAIVFHLCKNPDVLSKLREEMDEAREKGELSEIVKYQEAVRLPYLQAVIKEALRLQPVASFPLPRMVPKGGAVLSGRHFPEGTTVGINPFVAHRNKAVFGDDAESFRPERWLVGNDELREMDRYLMTVRYAIYH